jgi:hypothetical protein
LNEGEVVGSELIVAGCHAPTLLDLAKEPLDQISSPVKIGAKAQRLFPICFLEEYWRPGSMLADKRSDSAGIIASVSQQH